MMNDSIRELMDSCRGTEDELRQPEMQPLAELVAMDVRAARQLARSRELDTDITHAVHDVPIPTGLEQRLLAAMAEAGGGSPAHFAIPNREAAASIDEANPHDETSPHDAGQIDVVTLPEARGFRGRSWHVWAALATCAAALVLVPLLAVNWRPAVDVNRDDLLVSAMNWNLNDEDWIPGNQVWTKHPIPNRMFTTSVKRRQRVQLASYGISAACYELNMPRGSAARVFVFANPSGLTLPAAPPRAPLFTQGKCAAAWSAEGFVYVLVLEGDLADYGGLIAQPPQITFWLTPAAQHCATRTA